MESKPVSESFGAILGGLTVLAMRLAILWFLWRIAVAVEVLSAKGQ